MLEQEVAFLPYPAALLTDERAVRPVLLDGNSADSWGDGSVIFAVDPVATLEISPGGNSDPLVALQSFAADHLNAGCVGVAVALSYDLKHSIERLPRRHPWTDQPLLYAAAFDWAYRANRGRGSAAIVARTPAALDVAERTLARLEEGSEVRLGGGASIEPRMAEGKYLAMVERAKQYIAAGDIYQANLAQSFHAGLSRADAPGLFAQWTSLFPAPFAAYVDGGAWALVSNSPECFLDVEGSRISTCPIKGTRPLADGDDWVVVANELATDPKDRAEHVMIVDLERNDLGRVGVVSSVRVDDMQSVHRFPTLAHMISRISATLRPEVGMVEILRATFPGGSITGAPKIRAMQIIEELEPEPRGFYTGSIGWIESAARLRLNIAIRTALIDRNGLSFHAGGGIVADSDPQLEYRETLAKAETLFRALGEPPAASLEERMR